MYFRKYVGLQGPDLIRFMFVVHFFLIGQDVKKLEWVGLVYSIVGYLLCIIPHRLFLHLSHKYRSKNTPLLLDYAYAARLECFVLFFILHRSHLDILEIVS